MKALTQAEIARIEKETDFDVLNHSKFDIDIIDCFGDDGETKTLEIYGKTVDQIIGIIKSL